MGTASIRIVIVENDAIVRLGLRRLLDGEVEVVGEAHDGEEGLRVVTRERPDVVLLDLRMPKLDGIGFLRAARAREGIAPSLVLTTFDDPELLLDAVREGAKGFLLKDASFDELVRAIHAVAAGGTHLQPALTEGLLRGLAAQGAPRPEEPMVEGLTARELEVLRLMAGGYSNKEIAGAFGIAERTVKNHVSSVLVKLQVRDRMRAVLRALERRLL